MPRESYQRSLEELRTDVLEMGDLVLERLDSGLECLAAAEDALARTVIEGDDDVDDRYLALEDQCLDLIALQQPVAGDLRLVSASFKILTDLEHVGDLAVNLAGYGMSTESGFGTDVAIESIGHDAKRLLEGSPDAYANDDAEACWTIGDREDPSDARCQRAAERLTRELIEGRIEDADPWAIERRLDAVSLVLLTIRDLERVADHAVNVAARTLYMTRGDPSLLY